MVCGDLEHIVRELDDILDAFMYVVSRLDDLKKEFSWCYSCSDIDGYADKLIDVLDRARRDIDTVRARLKEVLDDAVKRLDYETGRIYSKVYGIMGSVLQHYRLLEKRIDRLEKEIKEIKSILMEIRGQQQKNHGVNRNG